MRETIEQFQAHLQGQLLASERSDQRFEHPSETAAVSFLGMWRQVTADADHRRPCRTNQSDRFEGRCSRSTTDRTRRFSSSVRGGGVAVTPASAWHTSRLPQSQFGRPSARYDYTPVRRAIPTVDQIARTAPERPHQIRDGTEEWRIMTRVRLADGSWSLRRTNRPPVWRARRLDLVDWRPFLRKYSCNATALLC